MAVFFTSDTHFGHDAMLGLYRRPFASVAEMDEALIARWNAVVGPGDRVWHLGDVAVGRKHDQVAAILDRLAGEKHLVTGNNDKPAVTEQPHWASRQPYVEIAEGGTPLVLCHYPFRSWNGMQKGTLNLHGHSHGRMKPQRGQYDVGVDLHDYRPVSLDELVRRR